MIFTIILAIILFVFFKPLFFVLIGIAVFWFIWDLTGGFSADDDRYDHEEKSNEGGEEDFYENLNEKPFLEKEAMTFYNVSPGFTLSELKKRRRELSKEYHPDQGEGAEELMKKVNYYYDILQQRAA